MKNTFKVGDRVNIKSLSEDTVVSSIDGEYIFTIRQSTGTERAMGYLGGELQLIEEKKEECEHGICKYMDCEPCAEKREDSKKPKEGAEEKKEECKNEYNVDKKVCKGYTINEDGNVMKEECEHYFFAMPNTTLRCIHCDVCIFNEIKKALLKPKKEECELKVGDRAMFWEDITEGMKKEGIYVFTKKGVHYSVRELDIEEFSKEDGVFCVIPNTYCEPIKEEPHKVTREEALKALRLLKINAGLSEEDYDNQKTVKDYITNNK